MTASPASSDAAGDQRRAGQMSIGEVLAQLRGEFPDVTISKLRFLEAEGLVEPRRTASGYRKYGWPEVARLRFVLSAQRDHYLPLRVIREQLAALDRGQGAAEAAQHLFDAPPAQPRPVTSVTGLAGHRRALLSTQPAADRVPPSDEPAQAWLTRDELCQRSGLTEPALTDLERQGMVRASGDRYDVDALTVARVVAQLAEYGLEPRHLRGYRVAADREVGLFAQLVSPLAGQRTPGARTRAAEVVRELAALSQQLHAALVRVGLRDTLRQ